MFGPRHTFESVAKDLVDGLEKGTIVLHPDEPTEADVEKFESAMEVAITRFQRRAAVLLVLGSLCILAGIMVLAGPELLYLQALRS